MAASAQELKKLKKVLAIKKSSTEAKYAQTKKIQNMVHDKIAEVCQKIERAKQDEIAAQEAFFGREQDKAASETDLREYVEGAKAASYNLRKEEKNKLLLEQKSLELDALLKDYQRQLLKIDKKAEHLFS